ncbi:unnamed protein product [Symbiodinium sp. CCMP2592]|nr:unnamed protein product [Symbiodinium sp. CCMP2592]
MPSLLSSLQEGHQLGRTSFLGSCAAPRTQLTQRRARPRATRSDNRRRKAKKAPKARRDSRLRQPDSTRNISESNETQVAKRRSMGVKRRKGDPTAKPSTALPSLHIPIGMADDTRRESFRFSSHSGQAGKQDIVKTGFQVVGHLREGILQWFEMASTGGVPCVSVKEGRVFAPGHGFIDGSRVRLDGVKGCECLGSDTFLAMSCTDDHFTLGVDVELHVSSAHVLEDEDDDGMVSIVTSQPHLCDVSSSDDPQSVQVVLRGFGELDGLSFEAFAPGESELHLSDFFDCETQGKLSSLRERLLRHPLTGAEKILLPDRKVTEVGGTGGWVRPAPRCQPLIEVKACWRVTLELALKFLCKQMPSVVATPVVPAGLTVGHCGTPELVGRYTRIADALGSTAGSRFQKGCIHLAFEPSLGLWAITVETRADPTDDLHCSRQMVGERCLRWEGPQLLYVCFDPSPVGRWLPILGNEPAPQDIREKHEEHAEPESLARAIDGRLPSGLIACIFGQLLDSRNVSLGGYIDFSFFDSGVRGLSAKETAKELLALEESAGRIAAICRSCHTLVAEWRRLVPATLRRCLYGTLADNMEDVETSRVISLMTRADLTMSIQHASDFRNRMWGAVPWSIVVNHPVSEGLKLQAVLPALKAFVRELFQGVGLPVDRKSFSIVRTRKDEDSSREVEWIELLEEIGNRPAALRTKPLLLCDGATAELFLPNREHLLEGLPAATMLLCRALRARIIRSMHNVEFEVQEHQAGGKCFLHRYGISKNSPSSDSCESCRRSEVGAAALCSETRLGLFLEMDMGPPQIFELWISAFVQPFLAKQTDDPGRLEANPFGGIEISWQTPPAVRVIPSERAYVEEVIGLQHQSGILASIDGEDVHRKSRAHIVGLLEDFRGSIKVIPTDSVRAALWISAQEALLLSSGSHPDAESKEGSDWHKTEIQLHSIHPMACDLEVGDYVLSIDGTSGYWRIWAETGTGCDWCGGLLIAWTTPPVIRAATPEAQEVFHNPILPGDVLFTIDGKVVSELGRKPILERMASMDSLGLTKPAYYLHIQAIRKDAQKALLAEPDNSSESLDWIAGILIRWSSPAEVQEVLPDVREFYPSMSPGDRLQSVHGTDVGELERAEVLHLLAQSPKDAVGLDFEGCLSPPIREKVRADAKRALRRGKKRHKDKNLPEGYNWIAGVQILWSKPPRVLKAGIG